MYNEFKIDNSWTLDSQVLEKDFLTAVKHDVFSVWNDRRVGFFWTILEVKRE
jgi:hypothetical protein